MEKICGIDEAGRGPTAGPVTAGAVVLPRDFPLFLLNDSKRLSPAKREAAASVIMERAAYGVGWVWPEEIDALNIHNASLLAMTRAFENLCQTFPTVVGSTVVGSTTEGFSKDITVLVDGLYRPSLPCSCRAIVKGDGLITEIMAASILAKTMRDRYMVRFSWIYPEWNFEKHKGYPTKEHRDLCRRLGPSPMHRISFKLF